MGRLVCSPAHPVGGKEQVLPGIYPLKKYKVTWEYEVKAEDEREAALEALRVQRDPNSIATVFEVRKINAPFYAWQVDVVDPEESAYSISAEIPY